MFLASHFSAFALQERVKKEKAEKEKVAKEKGEVKATTGRKRAWEVCNPVSNSQEFLIICLL